MESQSNQFLTNTDEWLAALTAAFPAELGSRSAQTVGIPIFEIEGEEGDLVPPGSIVVISSPAASNEFQSLVAAAQSGDTQRFCVALRSATRRTNRDSAAWLAESFEPHALLRRVDTYCTISYAGTDVAHCLCIAGALPLSVVTIPFNGGLLSESAFTATYYRNAMHSNVESIVVVRQPRSTAIERRLDGRYSAVQAEELVGPFEPEANWLVAGAVVGVVGAGVALAYVLARVAQKYMRQGPPEERYDPRNPEESREWLKHALTEASTAIAQTETQASASELLTLRGEMLSRKPTA